MLTPEDIALVELRPQFVPVTAIVPASSVVITTSGVVSLLGVETTVVSEGLLAVVSRVNEVNVRELAVFPAESVKVTVQT